MAIFGFDVSEKITYSPVESHSSEIGLTKNVILRKFRGAGAKVRVNEALWYEWKLTPNLKIQHSLADQMLSESPSELFFEERTFIKKNTKFTQLDFWIRKRKWKSIPSWVILGFIDCIKIDEQTRKRHVYDWLPVSTTACRLGTDK